MTTPMTRRATVKGETVMSYLRKFPSLPSKTIARLLVRDEPVLFRDVELARLLVRKYRGQCGKRNRAVNFGGRQFYRDAGSTTDGHVPLPEPLRLDAPWTVQKLQFKRGLVLGDVHIPFHDNSALRVAIQHGRKLNVDCILLNGDIADFHGVSPWERDPRLRNLQDEVEAVRLFFEHLRDRFPKARIIFKEGNHEERLWRFALRQYPETFTLEDGNGQRLHSLRLVFDLDEYGIELVDNKQPMLCGEHLYVLHGHEFRQPIINPVNPARSLFLKAKANALCGDLHQTSAHTESGIEHVISCWSHGCLCNLRPRYMPLNKWNHGFAVIELDRKAWMVHNHKIINGELV